MRLNTLIELIANEAYRHGEGYKEGMIYRSVGRYTFKNPVSRTGYNIHELDFEVHEFLAKVYQHAFRQGLNS